MARVRVRQMVLIGAEELGTLASVAMGVQTMVERAELRGDFDAGDAAMRAEVDGAIGAALGALQSVGVLDQVAALN
jgi:hypothetical protein